MNRFRLFAGAVLASTLALVPAVASAHTDLSSSDPADGSTVTEAPTEVVLTFEGEIGEDSSFAVTGPSGHEVGSGELDLDVADRNVLRGDVTVEDVGEYLVAYSIIGEDGDPIEGEVTFTFDPDGTATSGSPNTAMAVSGGLNVALLSGVALIATAFVLATRRVIRS